jgi:uncharacterized membrane protein YidH (DUF202 family)
MNSHDQVLSVKDDRPRGALVGRRSLAFTRVAAVLITVGIGAASFVLSFAALRDLASRAGIPGQLAWLWPMIVDGTILQATMAVVALTGHRDQERSRRYFWIVLSSSAAVSVGANALHAVIPRIDAVECVAGGRNRRGGAGQPPGDHTWPEPPDPRAETA